MSEDVTTPIIRGPGTHNLSMYVPSPFLGGFLTVWVEPTEPKEPVTLRSVLAVAQDRPLLSAWNHVEGVRLRVTGRPSLLRLEVEAACKHVEWTAHLRWEEP